MKAAFLLFILFISLIHVSVAQDLTSQEKLATFQSQTVKSDIQIGSIVEGSVNYGGMQPHYIIDYDNEAFKPLRTYAQNLKGELDVSKKIEMLRDYVTTNVLVHKDYDAKAYLAITSKYKKAGKNIPLSSYLKGKAGVCREHALIFHMALKDAGVKNSYLYARVFQNWSSEDHALNVVNINGEMRVVDIYNSNFHNQPLNQLLEPGGKNNRGAKVGIHIVNEYPAVYEMTEAEKELATRSKKPFFDFLKSSRTKCANSLRDLLSLMK